MGFCLVGCFKSESGELLTSSEYQADKSLIDEILNEEGFEKVVMGENLSLAEVKSRLNLVSEYNGAEINWDLSLADGLIGANGAILNYTPNDIKKKIYATIKKGKIFVTKEFELNLKKNESLVYVEGGSLDGVGSVESFFIGKYEVTQKEWVEVMGYNNSINQSGENYPVEKISWYEAMKFCNAKSKAEGLEEVYEFEDENIPCVVKVNNQKRGYRLPSRKEWLYAAKGGVNSKGYKYSGSNDINEAGWNTVNGNDESHPVGQKIANELGIYDMSGNVWEFTSETYTDMVYCGGGSFYWDAVPEEFSGFLNYLNDGGVGEAQKYSSVGLRVVLNK